MAARGENKTGDESQSDISIREIIDVEEHVLETLPDVYAAAHDTSRRDI